MQGELRPVDLARAVGVSVQTVRKYEAWGFVPPAERSLTGYRLYTYQHLHAIQAARTMILGYGWQHARAVMRCVHGGDTTGALALVDERHADLHRGRGEAARTLETLREVSEGLPALPPARGRLSKPLRVGQAARRAGVRVSALRFWEEVGLLQPSRDEGCGYRLYDEEQMGRLRVVVLLREGGYHGVLDELSAGRPDRALAAVERRRENIARASHACAQATAALWEYIEERQRGEGA